MGGFTRWVVVSLLALGLALAAACTDSGSDPGLGATVPRAAPSSTSTAPPADPYAVPAVIDAAYLNRVFEALDRIDGDATRLIVANRAFVPEAAVRLRAIYSESEFRRQQEQWLRSLERGLIAFRPEPGNRRSKAERVISSRRDCVYVAVARDLSAVTSNQPALATEYVALRPLDAPVGSRAHNPTPWMITAEGFNRDGTQPPDPCAS